MPLGHILEKLFQNLWSILLTQSFIIIFNVLWIYVSILFMIMK